MNIAAVNGAVFASPNSSQVRRGLELVSTKAGFVYDTCSHWI